jgi:hypothetical protein
LLPATVWQALLEIYAFFVSVRFLGPLYRIRKEQLAWL